MGAMDSISSFKEQYFERTRRANQTTERLGSTEFVLPAGDDVDGLARLVIRKNKNGLNTEGMEVQE